LLPQALSIFLLPIFTRYLSPDDFGILSYTAVLGSFFGLFGSLSIQMYIMNHYYDCKTRSQEKQMFGSILLFVLVHNCLLLTCAYLILPLIFHFLNVQVPFYPYVHLTLVSTAMELVGILPLSYFRARQEAAKYVSLSLAMTFLNGGLSVYLVVGQEMGLLGRYYGQLVANAVLLVVYLVIMARIAELSWNAGYVRQALAFCLPLVPAQLLGTVTSLSDRLILERYAPLAELGIYSVGFSIACGVTVLTTGVYSVTYPLACQLRSELRLDDGIATIRRGFLVLVSSLMFVTITFSREIVDVLAGPSFHESYKIVSILVVAILMQAFATNVPSLYLVAGGKTHYEAPIRLVGACVGIVAMLLLIPRMGVYGAGGAALAAAMVTLLGYQFVLKRESKLQWNLGKDLFCMGSAALLGVAVQQIQVPSLVVTGVVKLVMIGIVMGFFIWRYGGGVVAMMNNLIQARLRDE
jgi:O-antigen/teichoic acid export membrane protein